MPHDPFNLAPVPDIDTSELDVAGLTFIDGVPNTIIEQTGQEANLPTSPARGVFELSNNAVEKGVPQGTEDGNKVDPTLADEENSAILSQATLISDEIKATMKRVADDNSDVEELGIKENWKDKINKTQVQRQLGTRGIRMEMIQDCIDVAKEENWERPLWKQTFGFGEVTPEDVYNRHVIRNAWGDRRSEMKDESVLDDLQSIFHGLSPEKIEILNEWRKLKMSTLDAYLDDLIEASKKAREKGEIPPPPAELSEDPEEAKLRKQCQKILSSKNWATLMHMVSWEHRMRN